MSFKMITKPEDMIGKTVKDALFTNYDENVAILFEDDSVAHLECNTNEDLHDIEFAPDVRGFSDKERLRLGIATEENLEQERIQKAEVAAQLKKVNDRNAFFMLISDNPEFRYILDD